MILQQLEESVADHFQEDVREGRNLYFKTYYSDKPFESINFREFSEVHLDAEDIGISEENEGEIQIQVDENKIIIISIRHNNWLFVYTSALPDNIRKNLGRLSCRVGWLIDAWVPSETVEKLYQSYSSERDKVRIKRRWDPYYLYQNYSTVPSEMQEYYEDHRDWFEEQETEFSLKTPRWMVDEVLDEKLKEDFLERSEVSESRFNIRLSNPGTASVTVEQSGTVTHRSGEPHATIQVVRDVLEQSDDLHSDFVEVIPNTEYEYTSGGMVRVKSYTPPKILRLTFPEKEYNQEASIKLSNLLTVGQSEAKFHGFISNREGLDFRCRTYIAFDQSEYEILFTGYEGKPTIFVRPVEASVDGVIYLYHRLKAKFDTRIEWEILDESNYSPEPI